MDWFSGSFPNIVFLLGPGNVAPGSSYDHPGNKPGCFLL
jgi:hypothetical protein